MKLQKRGSEQEKRKRCSLQGKFILCSGSKSIKFDVIPVSERPVWKKPQKKKKETEALDECRHVGSHSSRPVRTQ